MEDTRVLNHSRWLTDAVIGALAGFIVTASFWAFEVSGLSTLSQSVWAQFSSLWSIVTLPSQVLAGICGHPITTYDEGAFSTRMVVWTLAINTAIGSLVGTLMRLAMQYFEPKRSPSLTSEPSLRKLSFSCFLRGFFAGGALTLAILGALVLFAPNGSSIGMLAMSWLIYPSYIIREAVGAPKGPDVSLWVLPSAIVANALLVGLLSASWGILSRWRKNKSMSQQ